MNIKHNIKKLFIYSGLSKEEYESVKSQVDYSNNRLLPIYSLLTFIYSLVTACLAPFSTVAHANFVFYIIEAIISLIVYIICKCVKNKNHYFLNTLLYFFMFTLILFSIFIGTIKIPNSKLAILPTMMFAVPLFFAERPFKLSILETVSYILFLIFGIIFKDQNVFLEDLLNVTIVYLLTLIMLVFVQKIKYSNYLYEVKLKYISDVDVLTGLFNRNCYERKIQDFQNDNHKECQLLFFDVNGLHELNNTYGHEAGDKMLKFISTTILEVFGSSNTFRIGGDEFIVLNFKKDLELDKKIENFHSKIKAHGYFVSIGYEYSPTHVIDFTSLSKAAETKMYTNKKEYYKGVSRNREMR